MTRVSIPISVQPVLKRNLRIVSASDADSRSNSAPVGAETLDRFENCDQVVNVGLGEDGGGAVGRSVNLLGGILNEEIDDESVLDTGCGQDRRWNEGGGCKEEGEKLVRCGEGFI